MIERQTSAETARHNRKGSNENQCTFGRKSGARQGEVKEHSSRSGDGSKWTVISLKKKIISLAFIINKLFNKNVFM